jgi:hypothetical protein
MSSTISLVIGAVGLLAAVFALVVVLRRSPGRNEPVTDAGPGRAQLTADAQRAFEDASRNADQVRTRAETEAAAMPAGTRTKNCARSATKPGSCALTWSAGKPGWPSGKPGWTPSSASSMSAPRGWTGSGRTWTAAALTWTGSMRNAAPCWSRPPG